MILRLMWQTEPPNKVSKNTELVSELEGTLRNPSSLIDPVITIERNSPTGFNYVHIPEFNRYYYVKNVISENNKLITIYLHVDVLMSFGSAIRQCDAIISRQENNYNLLLDDGSFKAYQNTKHKIIKFPTSGFSSFSYILVIAGNSDNGS